MSLIPESIKSDSTVAYDLTWKARLLGLNLAQLVTVMKFETNPVKLQLYLEMYGIDGNIFDFLILNDTQRLALFTKLIAIRRKSGTEWSICEMAKALGANNAIISTGYAIFHDGLHNHDGAYLHDGGASVSRFSVTITVDGIPAPARAQFEATYRVLFSKWQPVRLFLNRVIFI